MTESGIPRARNAATTRATILDAARAQFALHGYEQVGIRDVAATAGVNAALVIRYFGSKEGLFTEAVSANFSLGELLHGERTSLGKRLARVVLHKEEGRRELEPLLALLRSATSEPAASLLRRGIDEGFVRPLIQWLGPVEDAGARAGLVAAFLMGMAVTRYVVKNETLTGEAVERLVSQAGSALQQLLDGPVVNEFVSE